MLAAVVHLEGTSVTVHLTPMEGEGSEELAGVTDPKEPGPIIPELKELAWGAGSFIVFALLMRFFLFPRLKKGMDARYHGIRSAHESADAERAAARAEVAEYEAQQPPEIMTASGEALLAMVGAFLMADGSIHMASHGMG